MLKKQEYHYRRQVEKHEMETALVPAFFRKTKSHEMLKIVA
jgi:hypothetical protein